MTLIVSTDVIGLTDSAFSGDCIKRFGMIGDIQPVADVFAFTVNGDRLNTKAFKDHHWNQFFRKLIGLWIVGAVGD